MSAGVVSSVLNQLSALVVAEANLLGGLQQEIKGVVDELEHMKAFLMFVEDREEEDPRLQVWISQVRDVAYDIEDVVGEFLRRFNHNHGYGFYGQVQKFFISMRNLGVRHQIAQEIQVIKSRITSISLSHDRYQSKYNPSNQVSTSSLAVNLRHDYIDEALLVDATKLVGIDPPKQQLISQLLDDDYQFKVISVLGMGGIGKTTLVKKVQDDLTVKKVFHILAWVTVTQTWDMRELLKDLIKQLYEEIQPSIPQEVALFKSTRELKAHAKEFLKEKRYLIVFDDVWEPKFWDAIKVVLPEGSSGSCVVLTTRNAGVSRAPRGEFLSYVLKMKPLSFEDSWTLFCKKTFKGNCCPDNLKNVAEGILNKCGGLPLAIVAMGGLLALKDKCKKEWDTVERNLGDELMVSGMLDPVTKALSLSYSGLPHYLKTCLLHVSIFPEDYKISEKRLLRLWIAEGLVLEKAGMSKYEIAQVYLDELSNRSLIQVTQSSHPAFRLYHIHDILREIIVSKSDRQNYASIITEAQSRFSEKVRRLAIHDFKSNTKPDMRFKSLRSLVIFRYDESLPKVLPRMLAGGSNLLKVLDLEGTKLDEIPKEVFKLFHLNTLNLSRTNVKTISKSIGSLRNLEYLDLRFTEVRELPKEILNLKGLVHLTVNNHGDLNSRVLGGFRGLSNISKLFSLEWLFDVKANEILIKEIGDLKKLRRLGIGSLRSEYGKQLCSSLGKLFYLEHLYLYAVRDIEILDLETMNIPLCSSLRNLQVLYLWGRLEKVPILISSMHELTSVHLRWSRVMDNPLEFLQNLPNLLLLILEEAFEGKSLCFKAGCFLKLEKLGLYDLHSLRWLRVEKNAMPNLRELELRSLKLLEEFPWEVQHLTELQVLYLEDISHTAISQLHDHNEESGEFKQILNIPKILTFEAKDGVHRMRPRSWNREKNNTIPSADY